jgi:hypothetical protein
MLAQTVDNPVYFTLGHAFTILTPKGTTFEFMPLHGCMFFVFTKSKYFIWSGFNYWKLLYKPFHLPLVRWNSIRVFHNQNCHFISCIEACSLRFETTIKFYREIVESSYRGASESTSWLQQELLVLLFPVAQHCQDIRVIQ